MNAGARGRLGVLAAIGLAAIVTASAHAATARPATSAFRIPAPVVRKLDNGLTVAVITDRRLPIVQLQVVVAAGSAAEGAGPSGIARATADLLPMGTTTRDAASFAAESERLGGSIVAGANRDYASIVGGFLSTEFENGLDLVCDALLHPAFSDASLNLERIQAVRSVLQSEANPAAAVDELAWATVFPGHPYARPTSGTTGSLQGLTRDQIIAFHRDHYVPARTIVVIAGDVTVERAMAAISARLREWTGPATSDAAPSPAAFTPRIRVLDRPGSALAEIRVVVPAAARGGADEVPLTLASAVLGGGANARLQQAAVPGRGARSGYVGLHHGGLFALSVVAPADSARLAVERLREQLARLRSDPPSEAELAPIRHRLANAFPLQLETLSGVVSWWANALSQGGRPGDADAGARYRAADAAAVRAAVDRLDPERVAIVAVGPAATLREQLVKFGTVEVVGEEPVGADSSATREPTAAEKARGRELVRLAVVAHGGAARLRSIHDSTIEANVAFHVPGHDVQGTFTQVRKDPDRMRYKARITGIQSDQTLSGDQAWTIGGETPERHDMDAAGVADMKAGFSSDLVHLLREGMDPASTVASRGRDRIEDTATDAVEVVSPSGVRRVLHFDTVRHRLVAFDQRERSSKTRRVYGDFRPVDGVVWPYEDRRYLDGRLVMTVHARRVAFNTGVDDSEFDKPLELPAR